MQGAVGQTQGPLNKQMLRWSANIHMSMCTELNMIAFHCHYIDGAASHHEDMLLL